MGGILSTPKPPKIEPPPPVPEPAPIPVPDDIQQETAAKKRAARRISRSGRQSTLLSPDQPLGGG